MLDNASVRPLPRYQRERVLLSIFFVRLLRRLILAADHQMHMAHWGRLPESKEEATLQDGSNKGKHLAPACLIVDGTDASI